MHPAYQNWSRKANPEDISPLEPNSKTLIQEMPLENGPVHLECSIMINVME